ncbi:MAG: DUF721 domain-containing protein [Vibrio sp.]
MRDHRPESTQDLMQSSKMDRFSQHVGEIIKINDALKKILPVSLQPHCRAANVRNNQLLIEVATASFQIKLNYDRIRILSELRSSGFSKLISIEFKINPDLYVAKQADVKKKITYMNTLSEGSAESILTLTDFASPKLKQRLESLAKLAKGSQE